MCSKGAHQAGHDSRFNGFAAAKQNSAKAVVAIVLRIGVFCRVRPQHHVCFHLGLVVSKTHCSTAALLVIGCVQRANATANSKLLRQFTARSSTPGHGNPLAKRKSYDNSQHDSDDTQYKY